MWFTFFFYAPPTTEIYTLSLHDALPILRIGARPERQQRELPLAQGTVMAARDERSEEHTSELQSPDHLVCRLLLEKKKKIYRKLSESGLDVVRCATTRTDLMEIRSVRSN